MLTINTELQNGRYKITKQFGQGKTVSFYEAFDAVLEKAVLLKRSLAPQNVENERFELESKLLTEIENEGFLRVFSYFSEDNSNYLIMELVDGDNIGTLLKKTSEPFALADVVDWGEQILDALDYLHKKNPKSIYFNVKPQNLHLKADGRVKLLATGIGPNHGSKRSAFSFDASNLSYLPLELIWEKLDAATSRVIMNGFDEQSAMILLQPLDERCDIYSLGASLYQLLTCKPPVDVLERSIEILDGNPDPLVAPSALNPNISPEISQLLVTALEIKREKRFGSALEMRKELTDAYLKLRERKAAALRSEVPVAPGLKSSKFTKTVAEPIVNEETEIVVAKVNSRAEMIKQEMFDSEKRSTDAADLSEDFPGLELDSSDFAAESAVETPVPPHSESTLAEAAPDEMWQEEFTDEADEFSESVSENDEPHSDTAENSIEFEFLIGERKESKTGRMFAIAAALILLVGGGIFGAMKFMPFEATAKPLPANLIESVSVPETTEPAVESAETAPQTDPEESQTSGFTTETPEAVAVENGKPAEAREKTSSQQIAVSKTPVVPKSAVTEKKKVTVDDIINDTPKKKVTVDDLINDN